MLRGNLSRFIEFCKQILTALALPRDCSPTIASLDISALNTPSPFISDKNDLEESVSPRGWIADAPSYCKPCTIVWPPSAPKICRKHRMSNVRTTQTQAIIDLCSTSSGHTGSSCGRTIDPRVRHGDLRRAGIQHFDTIYRNLKTSAERTVDGLARATDRYTSQSSWSMIIWEDWMVFVSLCVSP